MPVDTQDQFFNFFFFYFRTIKIFRFLRSYHLTIIEYTVTGKSDEVELNFEGEGAKSIITFFVWDKNIKFPMLYE